MHTQDSRASLQYTSLPKYVPFKNKTSESMSPGSVSLNLFGDIKQVGFVKPA